MNPLLLQNTDVETGGLAKILAASLVTCFCYLAEVFKVFMLLLLSYLTNCFSEFFHFTSTPEFLVVKFCKTLLTIMKNFKPAIQTGH